MDDFTTALKEALDGGRSLDEAAKEILRKQTEKAVNTIIREELTAHLGYEKGEQGSSAEAGDARNGSYKRTLLVTSVGPITVDMPRDRNGGFESAIAPRYSRRTDGVADLVKSLYRQNMTVSEIEDAVSLILGKRYSESTIASMADGLEADVKAFRERALEEDFFALYADATYVPLRRDTVDKEAIVVIVGVDRKGYPSVLYFAIAPSETQSAWEEAFDSIRERGVKRCDVVVSDGFVGMREIVKGRFPGCRYQRCFVHLARNAGDMVRPSDRQSIMADFMSLAKLGSEEEAVAGLARFRADWAGKYPSVGRWVDRLPKDDAFAFYAFREEVRYIAYTNNRIEAFNSEIKRAAKKHIQWVKEEAEERFLANLANYYNLRKWRRRVKCWRYLDDPLA